MLVVVKIEKMRGPRMGRVTGDSCCVRDYDEKCINFSRKLLAPMILLADGDP